MFDPSTCDKTVREVWDSIPEELLDDCYDYIGEAGTISALRYGLPPTVPEKLALKLTPEQMYIVHFMRKEMYHKWCMGRTYKIDDKLYHSGYPLERSKEND